MLSVKKGGIKFHFWVFGMTRPKSLGLLAYTLPIKPTGTYIQGMQISTCISTKMQLRQEYSSSSSAIRSHVICEFYTFKPIPVKCAFKYDTNCMRWTLSYKIFIIPMARLCLHSLQWPKKIGKYINLSYCIRDFGQLLPRLHPQLRRLVWFGLVWFGLVWFDLVLWHMSHSRLFNTKSIFIQINSSISKNSV